MTDTSSRGLSPLSGSHNPFDDPRPKRQKGFWIAIVIAIDSRYSISSIKPGFWGSPSHLTRSVHRA